MSKVLLTAFSGKLSGIMEVPDNFHERDLWLMMDMETPSFTREPLGGIKTFETTSKRGRFQGTSGHKIFKDGSSAEVYKLVEIV